MPTFTDLDDLDPSPADAASADAPSARSPAPVGHTLPARPPLWSPVRRTPIAPAGGAGGGSTDDPAGRRARLEHSLAVGALARQDRARAAEVIAADKAFAENPDPGSVPVRAALLASATALASLVAGAGVVGILAVTLSQPIAVPLAALCVAAAALVSLCWRPAVWALGVVSGSLAIGVIVAGWTAALPIGSAALLLVGSLVALTASLGFDPSLARWRAARARHTTARAAVRSFPRHPEFQS